MSADKYISEAYDLLGQIVLMEGGKYSKDVDARLRMLRREVLTVPLILISSGTAGLVAGSGRTEKAVREYLEERNLKADIAETGSLGMCNAEPVVSIQLPGRARLIFKNITEEKVVPLLDDVFHFDIPADLLIGQHIISNAENWKNIPYLHEDLFFIHQQRLVLRNCGIIDPSSLEEYIAHGGFRSFIKTIRNYTHEEICDIVEQSGLRGRSGSGFLTGKKWKIAFHTPSDQKYLICNAEESDPGAFMDRAVIEGDPYLLLEGISIASYGIGTTKAFIYIRSEYFQAIRRLEHAISMMKGTGLLGHNILNSGFNLEIFIRKGPGAFVCGEETALINSLEGKRGMPETKPPYPAVSGLHRHPTIINNVETLSNVPSIIDKGPKWFSETGTENNAGTKVFSIAGNVNIPGLIEVPLGTPLNKVIFTSAGGMKDGKKIKAVHIGGPSGCILPEDQLSIPLDFDNLKAVNSVLGSGGIMVFGEDTCILDMVKYYADFMKRQSCGKCIPCREGTRRMSEILESITKKPVAENGHSTLERFKGVMQLESIAEVMTETSLCGLGRSAPNPVISALKHFREEFEEHIFDRKCRSNICTELRTYFIDLESCTGCSLCAKKCPEDAIFGTPLHPYFIVEEKCTGCGICFESCKFSAIYYK